MTETKYQCFDFLDRSSQRDSEVAKEEKGDAPSFSRKYTSVTFTKFYGGSITCRSLGCNLDCAYCFNTVKNKNPTNFGKFYTSQQIFEEILICYNKFTGLSTPSNLSTSNNSSRFASQAPSIQCSISSLSSSQSSFSRSNQFQLKFQLKFE